MKPILEVQQISKKYRIKHEAEGYLSLRERLLTLLSFKNTSTEDFWALNGVSFTVDPGECIGIIGRNGAGKSTLLKILSRITPPTQGRIIARGRTASLLEVGTGFHPELTGRENIFFNGSLLGMKRREIEASFDAIIDFSGVEKFLDTPLKNYSSGMQLRLAFSVGAFLDPEILIIDEVLSVGDAEFQRKCLGKMEDVSRGGRTILFVSHDLAAVEKLCSRTILLQEGAIESFDKTDAIIARYLDHKRDPDVLVKLVAGVNLTQFQFGSERLVSGLPAAFDIRLQFDGDAPIVSDFCLLIYTLRGYRVAIIDLRGQLDKFIYLENELVVRGTIPNLNLVEGEYQIGLYYGLNYSVGEVLELARVTVGDNQHSMVKKYLPQYRGVMELDVKLDSE